MHLIFAYRWFGCLIFGVAVFAHPVWAQSQAQVQAKSQAKPQAKSNPKPATPAHKNKVAPQVVSADITAQLQAMAAAEAAARSAPLLTSSRLLVPDLATPSVAVQTFAGAQPQPAHATEGTFAPAAEARAMIAVLPTVMPTVAPELLIAQQIHQGHLPCELGTSVRIEADATQPGFFHVHGKGFRYRMFPVETSTGALRLEDKKAGAFWLQLANKSMLMDQKRGRRLADECAHPDQLAFAETMKTNPPPSLIDTKGMGR